MTRALLGLMVLADDAPHWKWDPVEQAGAACEGGAVAVQLRAKHATDRTALVWAQEIRRVTRAGDVQFFVNDRFDLALAAEADGVHLGQDDLPLERIPAAARERLAIGLSTHSIEQARDAIARSPDYLAFGPLFGTRSKRTPYDPRGVKRLSEVVDVAAPLPVIAIGGIGLANAAEVTAAGAAGAAVISAVAGADDPVAAVRALAAALPAGSA